jgi:hypothetical protein
MQRYLDEFTFRASNRHRRGHLIFWLERCNAPDKRIELSTTGGANAGGFGLRSNLV